MAKLDWLLLQVFVPIVLVQRPPDAGAPGRVELLPDDVGDEQALALLQTVGRLERNLGKTGGLFCPAYGNLMITVISKCY